MNEIEVVTGIASYFKYWGKAKKDHNLPGDEYHLLPYHCLDVAAVGKLLLSPEKTLTKDIAEFLDITPYQLQSLFVFFLALHDLGKFSSSFQGLYPNSSEGLLSLGRANEYDGRFYRHDRMGLYFWEEIKKTNLLEVLKIEHLSRREKSPYLDSIKILVETVLGHHGQPVDPDGVRLIKPFTEGHNVSASKLFFTDVFYLLDPDIPLEKMKSEEWRERLKQVSWQLAGLAVLADWVGSDNTHFPYKSNIVSLSDYWTIANKNAVDALAATDLNKAISISPFLSIKDHYGFKPTPLQAWAEVVEIDDSPQLFILEDVTGAGKTEAALALTHRLMQAGVADGFYFGLPTMATSNAMFSRIAKHYQQMLSIDGQKASIVLAHGAREMNDIFREAVLNVENPDSQYDSTDNTATAQCNQWLADSRKKALLAPVGVGTIDQALLAVLPRRHQSLRLLGLNRKVLIFDEVHAADEFMFELLESLLTMHLHQGGSAILLTATLSQKQRRRLAVIWQKAGGLEPQLTQKVDFPLATKVSLDCNAPVIEQPLGSCSDVMREVKVNFISEFDLCVEKIIETAKNGQCVVWVRNTVNDALDAYKVLQDKLEQTEYCVLFHSRFVLQDRKDTEEKVLSIFGKDGDISNRAGKVLVATQVFQESLDADADLMISDICPIDDLIQRAGRLHRHTRNKNGQYCRGIVDEREAPELLVHAPVWDSTPQSDWLSKNFKNTQYVYRSPGRLWLGMRELKKLGAIRMPAEARQLIESVYSDEANEQIPEALQYQEDALIGEERSKAAKANSQLINWQYGYCDRSASAWHGDDADISTRYSDIETVEVVLLKRNDSGDLIPWVDAREFSIQLSTLKLSKNKYADKLHRLSDAEEESFKAKYRKAKYLQCWLAEEDSNFSYQSTAGFCEKNEKDIL